MSPARSRPTFVLKQRQFVPPFPEADEHGEHERTQDQPRRGFHAEYGQIVAAAVVPAAGFAPEQAQLQAALREVLSSYKVPRTIAFIEEDEIPRTDTGKVKLHELGKLISERGARQEAVHEPRYR